MFRAKKHIQSEEYRELLDKLAKLTADLKDLEIFTEALEQKYKRIQGLINRKLYYEDEEGEPIKKPAKEKAKYSDHLDSLRDIGL